MDFLGLACTTATATLDPSHMCNLHHSSRQYQILNPLSEARDWTCIFMDTSHIHFRGATTFFLFMVLNFVCVCVCVCVCACSDLCHKQFYFVISVIVTLRASEEVSRSCLLSCEMLDIGQSALTVVWCGRPVIALIDIGLAVRGSMGFRSCH